MCIIAERSTLYALKKVIVLVRIEANSRLYIFPREGHHSTLEQAQLIF